MVEPIVHPSSQRQCQNIGGSPQSCENAKAESINTGIHFQNRNGSDLCANHHAERDEDKRDRRPRRKCHAQPRPTNGIFVAMMVMLCTLTDKGKLAI